MHIPPTTTILTKDTQGEQLDLPHIRALDAHGLCHWGDCHHICHVIADSNSWHVFSQVTRVFRLSMNTIQNMMGTLQGIQVKSPLRHQCHPHCHEVNHNHQKQKHHHRHHQHWWNYHDLDQVRAEAYVTDYFYNNTQKGWCETRIINNTLDLRLEWWQSL